MQTTILDIIQKPFPAPAPAITLSFRPFVDHLKERSKSADCHRAYFFNYVIGEFENHPELLQQVNVEDVKNYTNQLQLIYASLSALIEDEEKYYWGLCLPIRPVIFFSTNALFSLVSDMLEGKLQSSSLPNGDAEFNRHKLEYSYAFILERLYNISYFIGKETVRPIEDRQTGLMRYYKQTIDNRFIKIHTTGLLPQLDVARFKSKQKEDADLLTYLQEVLPLDSFRFEGFGITSVIDVTAQYAIENIKTLLLTHSSLEDEHDYSKFIQSLNILVANKDIEFGILPILKINNRIVFREGSCMNSLLVKLAKEQGVVEEVYASMMDDCFSDPELLFFKDISAEEAAEEPYLKMLRKHGIISCALAPIFFNNVLVGLLEIYSKKSNVLDEDVVEKVEPAMPFLSQLLKDTIDDFNDDINKIIKEKFTVVQSSVQWKFNEVAWQYLQSNSQPGGNAEMEEIEFKNVYPLYGAVDIRNSTIERNAALNKDMQVQFAILIKVLETLKKESGFGVLDEKIFISKEWLQEISNASEFNQEVRLNNFLEYDIMPFLQQFTESSPAFAAIVAEYLQAINEKTGIAYENRRQLERSMTTIISSVNNYFDLLKKEIQKAYPCYFEKFRTDGVEYDVYIGQSIAPDKPYNQIYLNNLRLLQLTSMAAIAKYTNSLLPDLQKPVETTQLVFIHSHPIDIRFRKDEKRFDVEGAYNIRYHIIKKRIDKVRIKDTNERLTQPNKIALVYFSQKEADEYIAYIRYLQGTKVLNDDLEYLDMEELQGVSGLKALRVGVNLK